MSTPRFARGSKSRLFLYIGAITVAGVVVYFFHHAQVELFEYQVKSEKCLQQQESLSAQFQVIVEYKVRLEKSLQQEKAEHRHLMEELQAKLDEEKQHHEKDNLENLNKYTSLQQQHKILQSHHEDLNEECEHLRVEQLKGLDMKSKLESALESAKQEVFNVQKAKEKEMQNLKTQYLRMEAENEKLEKENKELTMNGKERNSNMNHLEKENLQLKRDLENIQGELNRCMARSSSPLQMVGPSAGAGGVGNAPKASSVPRISSSPVAVAGNLRAQVLQEPQHDHAPNDKISNSSPKSTTPQINPDAVLSREKAANAAAPMAVAAPDTVSKDRPVVPVAAAGDGNHREVSPRAK